MSEVEVPAGPHEVEVHEPDGGVTAEPATPRAKRPDLRLRKAEQIGSLASAMRDRLAVRVARGEVTDTQRERIEAKIAFDERRRQMLIASASMSREQLAARKAALEADLGSEAVYLEVGIPVDSVLDQRLLDQLAELSIMDFGLKALEE